MDSMFDLLPSELVDTVIDNLADDVASLKACTLVCGTWINRSRYHLFSTLRVGGRQSAFGDFLHTFINDAGHTSKSLFMVRTLSLDGKGLAQKPRLTLGTLQSMLRSMPNMRCLHLSTVRLDDADLVHPKPVPIDILTLVSVDACSSSSRGEELLAVLSLFSRIDSLLLRFVHFNHYPLTYGEARKHVLLTPSYARYPSKLEVTNLHLHLPRHTVFFLELFRRSVTRYTLSSLRVTCRTTEKFEAIGAFCADPDIGRTLEKLEIDLKYNIPRTSFRSVRPPCQSDQFTENSTDIPLLKTIAHLGVLQELTLSGLCLTLNTIGVDFNIFGIILPVLASMPSSTRAFTIVLLLMEPPDAACHIFERDANDPHTVSPWEQLEAATLERDLMKKPQCPLAVSIVLRSPFFAMGIAAESLKRIEECLRKEMHTLDQHNRLTLRFEEDYSF